MTKINIGIAGCLGRMGRELVKQSINDSRFKFSGGFEKNNNPFINKKISEILNCDTDQVVQSKPEEVFTNSDVIIDFTTPDSSLSNIILAEKTNKPIVIGTTGLSLEIIRRINEASNHVAILQSSNMSLAVNLLFRLVEETSSTLDDKNYDIEIAETHHKHKIDAPSGTALTLGEFASKGRNRIFDDVKNFNRVNKNEKRIIGDIGFSVTRGGEIPGEHMVSFIGSNDRVDISHKAFNRKIFIKGALEAALFLANKKNGLYSMKDVVRT